MSEKSYHSHKYPHFLLKKWVKDPWSKKINKRIKYSRKKHMGEKNYYPIDLENKLSKVEMLISKIFKKIDDATESYSVSDEEWKKIIIYSKIQTIRLENICNFINVPDEFYSGHNNFLFGSFSSNEKSEIIENTEILVDCFLNENNIFEEQILSAMGIVIWKNSSSKFVVTDNAIFKETDIDGNFLFTMMSISPNTAIIISKNSYFSSLNSVEKYKYKNGDNSVSMACEDKFLINNFKHESIIHLPYKIGRPKNIPLYYLNEENFLIISQAMIDDSSNLIFYDGDDGFIKKCLKVKNNSRIIKNW